MENKETKVGRDAETAELAKRICFPCPDCGTVSETTNLDSFPRNIALLNMVK